MKTIRNALILALLISVSLNTYLLLRPKSKTVRTEAPPAISSAPNSQSSPRQSTDRFDWRKVESPDYRKYIANLRLIGVPEETIRDLIVADVSQLYKAKWQHLLQTNRITFDLPMGKQPRGHTKSTLELAARELHGEKENLLKELLGKDFVLDEAPFAVPALDVERAMLTFLPSEKQEQTMELLRSYDQRWNAEIASFFGKGPIRPENRDPYLAFKHEKDAAVAKVLTPAEKEQYDLRFSQLAGFLQYKFQGLDLSEPAFVELYRYAKKHDDTLDFFLIDHGLDQTPFQQASLDILKKANQLAGVEGMKQTVPPQTAQRFGF